MCWFDNWKPTSVNPNVGGYLNINDYTISLYLSMPVVVTISNSWRSSAKRIVVKTIVRDRLKVLSPFAIYKRFVIVLSLRSLSALYCSCPACDAKTIEHTTFKRRMTLISKHGKPSCSMLKKEHWDVHSVIQLGVLNYGSRLPVRCKVCQGTIAAWIVDRQKMWLGWQPTSVLSHVSNVVECTGKPTWSFVNKHYMNWGNNLES